MPRGRRIEVPGIPLHVVQRGVNRTHIFVDDHDRRHYLALLDRARRRHELAIHAYVLMTNHVHLLLSATQPGTISAAMHALGTAYVHTFNQRHERVGALWQGRFKSCLVDHDRYLIAVYRYIELNPVRAGMVMHAEQHRWSSVHGNAGYIDDPLLTPHPTFLATANDATQRAAQHRAALRQTLSADITDAIRRHTAAQRALAAPAPRPPGRPKTGTRTINPLREQLAQDMTDAIRRHTAQERALGSDAFRAAVEQRLGRHARLRPNGRPPQRNRDGCS